MIKQIFVAIFVTGLVVAGLAYAKYMQISKAMAASAKRKRPPTAVTSYIAKKQDWPVTLEAIGTVSAQQGTMLSTEAGGRVASIGFESGHVVEKGHVLIELDMEVEQAELESAKAKADLAELNAKRQSVLRRKQANSQSDLDTALAELRHAKALVSRLEATIERRKIVAPFAGTTGIIQVDKGETVSVGTPVVSLQAFDKLHVDFTLPQQSLAGVQVGADVEIRVDAFPDKPIKGTLTAIDSEVSKSTRNIKLRATFDNKESILRPGMFANVKVILPEKRSVVVIPSSSIKYAPYGNSVWVISKGDAKAPRAIRQATVCLGKSRGELVSVLKGVKAGEEVVSSGTFRLRPKSMVVVNNEVQPGSETNPNPSNS